MGAPRKGWLLLPVLALGGCVFDSPAAVGRPCASDDQCGPGTRCELPTKRCVAKASSQDGLRSEARADAPGSDLPAPPELGTALEASTLEASARDQRAPDVRSPDLKPPPSCTDKIQNGSETDVDCGGSCTSKCANGKKCSVANDCSSGLCQGGVCVATACTNGVKDGTESDVDCGGLCPVKCAGGKGCIAAADCASKICAANVCTTASCTDKVLNGTETDLDCGGTCPKCGNGKVCAVAADCTSAVCTSKVCQAPTCSDGAKNGSEGDVDCGGTCPSRCSTGKKCNVGSDCVEKVCSGGTCAAASCPDGVKNGNETDVDCGGSCTIKCAVGKSCSVNADCAGGACQGGKCVDPCFDGIKDGTETDIDCGGSCAAKCADGKHCVIATDCVSKVCKTTVCQVPTCTDGVRNGTETDIDCGGSCPACGGTCPMLYTFDGTGMQFESDLFPRGMLGFQYATGYLKPNPNDYYLLRHTPAKKADGLFDLRLIEERREVDYLDQAKLYAIDVPAGLDVYSEILFVGPAYLPPDQIVHSVATPLQQVIGATHLETMADITTTLGSSDGQVVVLSADRNDMEWNTLELNLGSLAGAPRVKLVIDARSAMPNTTAGTLKASSLELPGANRTFLQVRDATGAWVTVPKTTAALPIPKEFPRPFVVDVTNAFVADRQKIRLGFLYKTYVDSIRFDTSPDQPVTVSEVPLAVASLDYHGIDMRVDASEMALHIYGQIHPVKPYSYFPGLYTAFTDVTALLQSVDDLFVIFGPGDEVTLRFGPEPAKAAGTTRRYLVYTHGYYKSDKATTISWTVAPLPFAAMSGFPYDPLLESYPTDAIHQSYLSTYNTRQQ